jgi:hypothetical protein
MTWCLELMADAISARQCYHRRHQTEDDNKTQPVIEEAPSLLRFRARFVNHANPGSLLRLQPVGVQSKDLIFANENLWFS